MGKRIFLLLAIVQTALVSYALAGGDIRKGDTLTMACPGNDSLAIQWQFSNDRFFWKNIDGATQPALTTLAEESGFFRAKYKNGLQSFFSDTTFVYVTADNDSGPAFTDNDHTVKFSWDFSLPRHLIDHYRVTISGLDTVFTLHSWHSFLQLERTHSLYNTTVTIEAVPDGNFSLPTQSLTYSTNYSRFFDGANHCIAHRGLSANYPENTGVAFEKAAEAGFTFVECDLWLTKDDVWVLHHDETIDRTSNGKGAIADYYYDDLLKFDFGYNKSYDNKTVEKIPTLTDFLSLCRKYNLKPIFEIKEKRYRYLNLVQLISTINQQLDYSQYAIQCFDLPTLRKIRRIDNQTIVGWLVKKVKASHEATLGNLYPSFYNIAFNKGFTDLPLDSTPHSLPAQLYQSGVYVATWTVDHPAYINQLLSKGWWIMTDQPLP